MRHRPTHILVFSILAVQFLQKSFPQSAHFFFFRNHLNFALHFVHFLSCIGALFKIDLQNQKYDGAGALLAPHPRKK